MLSIDKSTSDTRGLTLAVPPTFLYKYYVIAKENLLGYSTIFIILLKYRTLNSPVGAQWIQKVVRSSLYCLLKLVRISIAKNELQYNCMQVATCAHNANAVRARGTYGPAGRCSHALCPIRVRLQAVYLSYARIKQYRFRFNRNATLVRSINR